MNKIMAAARLPAAIALALASAAGSVAEPEGAIESVYVTGIIPEDSETLPGAIVALDRLALDIQRPFSIKEALQNVAGANVVAEDVFSTHLNIGMRGLNPRRSARTLLMEDGLPLFLAPYGDPSAHYSPPIDRVERIEVVKGASQVLYGPQTIGGVINFVTSPVPTDGFRGRITTELGNNDFQNVSARIGFGNERGGLLLSVVDKSGDGVRDNHRLGLEEYLLKGRYQLSDTQTLTARFSRFEENSNVSETGLSRDEFANDPFQAPTGRVDRFQQARDTLQLRHEYVHDDTLRVDTQVYRVTNERASFRQINGPGENIELCPADGDFADVAGLEEALAPTEANSALCGGRWRPRSFEYHGIEPKLTLQHNWFGAPGELLLGARFHQEDIARNQFRGYDSRFQSLAFARSYRGVDEDDGRAGWHNELIETQVNARSFYAQNAFTFGNWVVTPGIRVEDVTITTDYLRTEGAAPTNPQKRGSNSFTEVLPGIGVNFNGVANSTIFAGIHKGFAPARPSREVDAEEPDASFLATDPEESWNFELGIRSLPVSGVEVSATLFHTDFSEIVIQTEAGRFINAGASVQTGLEFAGRVDFGAFFDSSHNVYLEGNYTGLYRAEFTNSQVVFDEEGEDVLETASFEAGNRLPYAPRHMLSLGLGYESPSRSLDARVGVNYVGEQYVDAANTIAEADNGMEGRIPAYTLVSASLNYRPAERWTVSLAAQNLADRVYLASRVDGMVAGRRQQLTGAVRFDF
ncbi:MAG: TonB-dependent receptor [Halieaceae bacterium]|jgi:Fe(3+) dicitrate transport protein|nr:TonB-dependent receptor [Halieaceae bacterium]